MARIAELLDRHGIALRNRAAGNHKTLCPRCSHTRRNARDPCLSVWVGDAAIKFLCHHCGWKGADDGRPERNAPAAARKPRPRRGDRVASWRGKLRARGL